MANGFARGRLAWSDRDSLRSVVGEAAEALVYLYGACDRPRSVTEQGAAAIGAARAISARSKHLGEHTNSRRVTFCVE